MSITLERDVTDLQPTQPFSTAACGILSRAPPALMTVFLMLYGLEQPTTFGNRQVLRLQTLDRLLNDTSRFPELASVRIYVSLGSKSRHGCGSWVECIEAACEAMAGLHDRGLLKVTRR